MDNALTPSALLILPRIRVQNANAISSPMTWGFPSVTAFLGLMWALERNIPPQHKIGFDAVGVVCHHFEPQTNAGGFTRSFTQQRYPLDRYGAVQGIVEEGRAHMEISLIFNVAGDIIRRNEDEREAIALSVRETLGRMRIAGGSVLPSSGKRKEYFIHNYKLL